MDREGTGRLGEAGQTAGRGSRWWLMTLFEVSLLLALVLTGY